MSCCFFAAMDEPAPMIRSFFRWNVVCLVLATVYLFVVILPNAHDFEMLVLMFAAPYLLIGLMMAQPRLALIAMPLAVVTANDIGLQGAYNADFNAFFNGNVAGIAGILFALVRTLVARPFGTRAAVRRLVRASWGDIARNATGREPGEHANLRARMLDRLAQIVPRLAASEDETTSDGFTEVRVELSTLALQREAARAGAGTPACRAARAAGRGQLLPGAPGCQGRSPAAGAARQDGHRDPQSGIARRPGLARGVCRAGGNARRLVFGSAPGNEPGCGPGRKSGRNREMSMESINTASNSNER
ncbi:FUSC family protein [Cupriavidus basilensis]